MSTVVSSPTLAFPDVMHGLTVRQAINRTRSSSILKMEKVGEDTQDEALDSAVYENVNAEWVNRKGAWLIHPALVFGGKMVIDTIPGMRQDISWFITNLTYLGFSYLMFHWVTGIPFQSDLHSGVYDELTLWEQIDQGAQYTPAKKWLLICPILLFLASTHYSEYNPWMFAINLTALIVVLIPKLPMLHRRRVRFMVEDDDPSNIGTPSASVTPRSGSCTPTSGEFDHRTPIEQITVSQF
ncbi:Orm1 type endoplasmic reticulum protein [Laetiporus sulphureus 93-53]|uniref:Orm1 type endoplasmic reticulum protein n=1 Tax=Laetiporus sulphureus 93-53 TaxID=1314785 RepID=A0A165DTX9_9APHY|nr:Orm1 type endoplasmic reticulum protein [Laetiporus sulphureus 93-53]KZT05627.1 Orm1 type endoplasmic reticulum protein [Laetiporus sulphureus 93-53]